MAENRVWWLVAFVLVLAILSRHAEGAERIPPPSRVTQGVSKDGRTAWVHSQWVGQPIVEFAVKFHR